MKLDVISDADTATTNAFYRALTASCRRRVLRWLAAHDPVPLAVLASSLADEADETSEDVATVRLRLHHVHVPKLVDAGLVRRTGDELLTVTDRGEAAVVHVDSWAGSSGTRSVD